MNGNSLAEGEQLPVCVQLHNATVEEGVSPLIGLAGTQNTSM